ncbi:MFS transporter [Pseudomonas syringae]|uniref:MFS transporter n=1 Tax=Pseudomonas syringae TaxID=317 RepID=A0A244EU16_PSESX|nr:MFS transporter [Pseudomonas syringae]MCI3945863.1 MFS transporter [Pseudomonas syringae]OUM07952.1 MFS transporter [Pseudomonas syringae]
MNPPIFENACGTQRRSWAGLLLLLGSCLPILGGVLIAPVLPRIAAHFAGSANVALLVPIVLTLPALMIALFSPFAGWFADRLGRKRLLVLAMGLYGCCGALPLLLDDLVLILLSRAGLGLAEAAIMTCCTTLIGDYYSGSERARLLSWQTIATALSAATFFMVGGILGENGWRTPFVIYMVGLLFVPLMHVFLWEPLRKTVDVMAAVAPITPSSAFPWRTLLVIYLLTSIATLGFFVIPVQTGYLLAGIGIDSPKSTGLAIGLSHAAVLVGALSFRWLNRTGPGILLAVAFLISGLGLVLLAGAHDYRTVLIAMVVNGLGCGLMLPTVVNWALSSLSFQNRGRGTGGFNASFFGGQFASPLLVMAAISLVGNRAEAVELIGFGLLFTAVFCLAAPRLAGLRLRDPIQNSGDAPLH